MAERLNLTLEEWLNSNKESEETWAQALPRVLQAYRTSKHSVTGFTPFELVYGNKPTLPVDSKYELDTPACDQNREEMVAEAKNRCHRAAQRMAQQYNKKNLVKEVPSLDGLRVYQKNEVTSRKKNHPRFIGPFMAQATNNPRVYNLIGNDGVSRRAHVSSLMRCYNQAIPLATIRRRGRPRRPVQN